jgi:hypothetical protein
MDPYWLGLALLVILCSAAPLARRFGHAHALKSLGIEGITVLPSFWKLGQLRYSRPGWEAGVRFELPGEFGGGQRGHLQLSAKMGQPTGSLKFHAPGPAADAAEGNFIRIGDPRFEALYLVKGDPAFGVRLMLAETRELLVQLAALDGRIWAIHEGTVEITGPFLTSAKDLKAFLELCARLLDRVALAAAAAEASR